MCWCSGRKWLVHHVIFCVCTVSKVFTLKNTEYVQQCQCCWQSCWVTGLCCTCRPAMPPSPRGTGCAHTWRATKTKSRARCVGSTWEQRTWQTTWRSIVKDQAISALSVTEVMSKLLFNSTGMGWHWRGAVRLRDSLQQEEAVPCLYILCFSYWILNPEADGVQVWPFHMAGSSQRNTV